MSRLHYGVGVLIDLNADLGVDPSGWSERVETELASMASSVNVPCGAHVGDPVAMQNACATAAGAGLAVGALVGYRDPFGRGERFIDYSADDLTAEIIYQLGALDGIALTEGTRVSYVRPSGALLDAVQTDRQHAWALVNAVLDYDPRLIVVALAGSNLRANADRHGLATAIEFHPHRLVRAAGELGAEITDPAVIRQRALAAVEAGDYATIRLPRHDGASLTLARTISSGLAAAGHQTRRFSA